MKAYLDTSVIRQYSNQINEYSNKYELRTSCLTLFELISGINDADFSRRKIAIERLLNSKVEIDWDFCTVKVHKAFKIPYAGIDSEVIKRLVHHTIISDTYEELCLKTVTIDGFTYSLSDLVGFDNHIVDLGIYIGRLAQNEAKKLSKDEKKKIKEGLKQNMPSFLQVQSELALIPIILDLSGADKQMDDKYLSALNDYDWSLQNYLKYNSLLYYLAELEGRSCGKNDVFDMLHYIYTDIGDTIISEDKIFKIMYNCLDIVNVCTMFVQWKNMLIVM